MFEVSTVKAASQQTLAQAKDTIRNLLRSQREQKALDEFVKDFREKYKDKTNCADDYRVAECKNAPKDASDTGPASGGAPRARALRRRRRAPPQHAAGRRSPGRDAAGAAGGHPQAPQGAAPQPPSASGADQPVGRVGTGEEAAGALERLDEITRRLRRECPWDREQDERSIVPHTVEEAYELADAAHAGDDAKLLDELGDVLFQVFFLSLLLEERGAGDLAAVADDCREKLIRRHPHVFGDAEAESAGEVLRNWDRIKSETEGGGTLRRPARESLPSTLLRQEGPAPRRARRRRRLRASASGGRRAVPPWR